MAQPSASPVRGRTVWILNFGSTEGVVLGPIQRVVRMGRLALDAGFRPVLAFEKGKDGRYDGMEIRHLDKALVSEIAPGDAVIAAGMLDVFVLKALLDRGIGFDVDLYGLPALEHIEIDHQAVPSRKLRQSRRRMGMRFRFLAQHCERLYLSNPQQLAFLGGLMYASSGPTDCRLASALPAKTMFLPMGCPDPAPCPPGNPFPEGFRDRPVFLWGGGIWSWFDTDTLLKAFKILSDKGSDAALYFVCGTNPSGLSSQDGPVRRTWARARELGLLERMVAFHDGPVAASELPAYLGGCAAAIMANPSRLESTASWRTRLLDAPPFGKPVVVSGFDPLSSRMVQAGAGLSCPAEDPEALASIIDRFCTNPELRRSLEEGSARMRDGLSWDAVFQPWLERLSDSTAFSRAPHRIGLLDRIAFILGA